MPARHVRTVSARRVGRPLPATEPGPATAPRRPVSRRRQLWALAVFLVLMALGVGGWRLYNSSLFVIHDVQVTGTTAVSADQVRDAAAVNGSRFFTLDTTAAAER